MISTESVAKRHIFRASETMNNPNESIPEISDDLQVESVGQPDQTEIENIVADLGGDGNHYKFSVYRANTNSTSRWGPYLFSCAPEDFTREDLLARYGGGQYRVHVIKNGARGFQRVLMITLEAPKNAPATSMPQLPALPVADQTGKLIEAMQAGFAQLGQMIVQANANSQPHFDPDAARRGMLQDMLMMKQIMTSDAPQNQNMADKSIEMVMKGIELAREISPREGGISSMDILLEGLKTFGKPIAEAAMARMAVAPQELPGQQVMAGPIPALPAAALVDPRLPTATMPLNPTTPGDDVNIMMRMYAAQLAKQARDDRDPYVYASLFADQLADDQIDGLLAQSDSQLLAYLAELNVETLKYQAWMLQFIGQVREILTPEPEPGSVNAYAPVTIDPAEPANADHGSAEPDPQR